MEELHHNIINHLYSYENQLHSYYNSIIITVYQMIEEYLGVTDPWIIKIIQVSLVTAWLGVILLLNGVIKGRCQSSKDDSEMEDCISGDDDLPNINNNNNTTISPATAAADKVDLKERTISTISSTVGATQENRKSIYDFDQFMIRLHYGGMIVHKIKEKKVKSRCLRISAQCELKLYKIYRIDMNNEINPRGPPYVKLPLVDLLDCFECEETRKDAEYSFILEFKQKTLQLAGTSKVETKNLIRGFRHLIDRLQEDRRYLEMWTQRFRSPTAYARQITPTSITGVVIDTSNKFASPLTPNTSSLSSWRSSK